jgi:hypothetical protein
MTTPTEMTNELFSTAASELAIVSTELRRNLKRTRRVDFAAENHLHEAIENLQQTLCAIWDEFEDDELSRSWHRPTPPPARPKSAITNGL